MPGRTEFPKRRALLDRVAVRRVHAEDLLADPNVACEDPLLASLEDVDTPVDLVALTRTIR